MNNNELSIDDIQALLVTIRANPIMSVNDYGISFGDGNIIFFKIDNFQILYNKFFNSPQYSSNEINAIKLREAIEKLIKTKDFIDSTIEFKINKILGFCIQFKLKKVEPCNWVFYNHIQMKSSRIITPLKFSSPQQSPMYNTSNTPNNLTIEYGETKGVVSLFQFYQTQISQDSAKRTPKPSPRMSEISFEIKSFEEVRDPLIDAITKSLSIKPFYQIKCGDNNKLYLTQMTDNEDNINLSYYKYCPFHSSSNFGVFEPISNNLKTKIENGVFGFLTKSCQCYDICYMNIVESVNQSSVSKIKDIGKELQKILSSVKSETSFFIKLLDRQQILLKSKKSNERTFFNSNMKLLTDLGRDSTGNNTKLQGLLKEPVLTMIKKEVVTRYKKEYRDTPADLNIVGYTNMCSLFGEKFRKELENKTDNVEFRFVIYNKDDLIVIDPGSEISNNLLSRDSKFKNNILEYKCNVLKNESRCIGIMKGDLSGIKFNFNSLLPFNNSDYKIIIEPNYIPRYQIRINSPKIPMVEIDINTSNDIFYELYNGGNTNVSCVIKLIGEIENSRYKYKCVLGDSFKDKDITFTFTNTNNQLDGNYRCDLVKYSNNESNFRYLLNNISDIYLLKNLSHHFISKIPLESKIMVGASLISKYNSINDFIVNGEGDYYITRSGRKDKIRIKITDFGLDENTIKSFLDERFKDLPKEIIIDVTANLMGDFNQIPILLRKEIIRDLIRKTRNIPEVEDDQVILYYNDGANSLKIHKDEISYFFTNIRNKLKSLSKAGKREEKRKHEDLLFETIPYDLSESVWEEVKSFRKQDESDLTFDNISSLKYNQVKDDIDDDIKSVTTSVSDKTRDTGSELGSEFEIESNMDISDLKKERVFNETFYDSVITIDDIVLNGWICKELLDNYSNILDINFDDESVDVSFEKIKICNENLYSLYAILYDEVDEDLPIRSHLNDIINKLIDEYEFLDRTNILDSVTASLENEELTFLRLSYIFNSPVEYIIAPIDNSNVVFNLKSKMNSVIPALYNKSLPSEISSEQTSVSRLLNNIKNNCMTIDVIATQCLSKMIDSYGSEIFTDVFTGALFKRTPNDKKREQGFIYENRLNQLQIAEQLYSERFQLMNLYDNQFFTYFSICNNQDYDDGFANSLNNYILFTYKQDDTEYDLIPNDTIIPDVPFYSGEDKKVKYSSLFPSFDVNDPVFNNIFLENFTIEEKINGLETVTASELLQLTMKFMYGNESDIRVGYLFGSLLKYDISNNNSYFDFYVKLILLHNFMLKVSECKFKFADVEESPELNDIRKQLSIHSSEICENIKIVLDLLYNNSVPGKSRDNNIPTKSNLNEYIDNLFIKSRELLKFDILINDKIVGLNSLMDEFIKSFKDIPGIFMERRDKIKDLCIEIYEKMYIPIHDSEKIVRNSYFTDLLSHKNTFNDFINKCSRLSETINYSRLCKTEIASRFDLKNRFDLFNKYKTYISDASHNNYQSVVKSFYYYLFSNIDISNYRTFIDKSYSEILTIENGPTLREKQEDIRKSIKSATDIKEDFNKAKVEMENSNNDYKKVSDSIKDKSNFLISSFIEYISIIDIITKSFGSTKISYEIDDIEFKRMIDNYIVEIKSIEERYSTIDDNGIKIMLSLFKDNYDIYNMKKNLFKRLQYSKDETQIFNDTLSTCNSFLSKMSGVKHENRIKMNIDNLAKLELSPDSNYSAISMFLSKFVDKETINKYKSNILINIFMCNVYNFINDRVSDIKMKIQNNVFNGISIPTYIEKPRFAGYGDELNRGIIGIKLDVFSLNNLNVLSSNITEFIRMIDNSLSIINCGPGLHLMSDCFEDLNICIKSDTIEKFGELFTIFKRKYEKLSKFMTNINSSLDDFLGSTNFDSFVNVINGTFKSFKGITDTINFFNNGEIVYQVYENLTPEVFRNIILFMKEISSQSVITPDSIIEIFNKNSQGIKYDKSSITTIIDDANSAIIPFIDEFYDSKEQMLIPSEYVNNYQNYYIQTKGKHMVPLFKKLNQCVLKYVAQCESNILLDIDRVYCIYISKFVNKFKGLKDLDSDMLFR